MSQADSLLTTAPAHSLFFLSSLYFPQANLFTGVVNVSMQTMHANTLIALVVLTSYVAISSAIGPVLTWFDVRLPI